MIKVTYWNRPYAEATRVDFDFDSVYHVKEFKKWTLFRRIWFARIRFLYDEIQIEGSQE